MTLITELIVFVFLLKSRVIMPVSVRSRVFRMGTTGSRRVVSLSGKNRLAFIGLYCEKNLKLSACLPCFKKNCFRLDNLLVCGQCYITEGAR